MVFIIAVGAVLLPILFGLLLATAVTRFDKVVADTKNEVENSDKGYNPALTLGYEIKTSADPQQQFLEARKLAAKKAAALPRGSNVRIGRDGNSMLQTAWQGVENDPMTAVKIARFHGWQGVKTGVTEGAAAAAAAPAAAATITIEPPKLVEITDDMDPADVRKARIANAKAKSAYNKALKEAGIDPSSVKPGQKIEAKAPASAAPAAGAAAPAAAAPPVNIEPPKLTEITDDMSPDEVRKARIANSKAKSAYNKALKAAGVDPSSVKPGQTVQAPAPAQPAAAPPPAAAPADGGADAAAAAGIPKPELVEITDDMSPDEIRQARISNAKAKSAYNKALKAAGIDPSSVN